MSDKRSTALYIRVACMDNNAAQQQEERLREYADEHSSV